MFGFVFEVPLNRGPQTGVEVEAWRPAELGADAVGVAKTKIIGGRPWKFNVQYWHYIVSPDSLCPNCQIRIAISPVVALRW